MTTENKSRSITVHTDYLYFADELNQLVEKNGPHWAVVLRGNNMVRAGYRVVFLGNGKIYNPVSNEQLDLDPDMWVQRFHKDAEQFKMTATDAAIKAASQG